MRLLLSLLLCLSCLSACGGDENTEGPDTDKDTAGNVVGDTNFIGKTCASNDDCTPHGLTCYILGAGAEGICSRGCTTESDCGGGLAHCNSVQGALVCTLPRFCDPCDSEQECGPEAPVCLKDDQDVGFCSPRCTVQKDSCPSGTLCRKFGANVDDFACVPASGSCNGDGTQCSPCKTDGDCSGGHTCFQANPDSERYCAKSCNPDAAGNDGCTNGYKCTSYGGSGVCYQIIDGKPKATCSAGSRGFCDPCEEDWQCGSGRCVEKLIGGSSKRFCGLPDPCSSNDDCPLGGLATFCVDSSNEKGKICAPPAAYNCHGYKACFSHPCQPGTVCIDGVCKAE